MKLLKSEAPRKTTYAQELLRIAALRRRFTCGFCKATDEMAVLGCQI